MEIHENSLVKFKNVMNARGYPLTGVVTECDEQTACVEVFGLYGPGVNTTLMGVPVDDLEDISPPEVKS